jgi:alcohol dehydrogenase, propanol-preferring
MAQAGSTYRAVQAVSPGKLELTEKPLLDPNPGHVRIRVEACGVCHSDAGTVEGVFPIEWPRVPGHEAVGHIDAVGGGVEGWKVGQLQGNSQSRNISAPGQPASTIRRIASRHHVLRDCCACAGVI